MDLGHIDADRLMMSIGDLLPFYGLAHHEARLRASGIHSTYDLFYFTEYELLRIGISLVEARMLLSSLAGGWTDWSGATATSAYDPSMMSDVQMRANEKEREAVETLQSCLQLACKHKIVTQSIQHALQRLNDIHDFASSAFLALTATSRARASCRDRDLRKALDRALKVVRDVVVWRVQMNVPWGNRQAFLDELERAHGSPVNQEMLAQLLQSHSKTICEEFPSAFLSGNKIRRRAPRPPKSTTRAENARGGGDTDMEPGYEVLHEFQSESFAESSNRQPSLATFEGTSEASFTIVATGAKGYELIQIDDEEDSELKTLIAKETSEFLGGSWVPGEERVAAQNHSVAFGDENARIQALVHDFTNILRDECVEEKKPEDSEQQTKMSAPANLNAEVANEEVEQLLKDGTAGVGDTKVVEEFSRMREQIAELRKELDIEKRRARQSDTDHARDLKKCQHVIVRLINELEMVTRTRKEQPPLEPMADLSNAIGMFFDQLGTTKSNNAFDPDAEAPRGYNDKIDDDGQNMFSFICLFFVKKYLLIYAPTYPYIHVSVFNFI